MAMPSPTKGNLLALKKSLQLAQLGYELLDRKRNILVKETVGMIDKAKLLEKEMRDAYTAAHAAIKEANMQLGIVDTVAAACPLDNNIEIVYHSIMGVDVPHINGGKPDLHNFYGFYDSTAKLDKALVSFSKAKALTMQYSELENSIFSLADGIKHTKKRANALKNIIIPRMQSEITYITAALEEKEREEFTRLKVIKSTVRNNNR